MTDSNSINDDAEIETTIVFDIDHYPDYITTERVAEAIIELGERRVEYVYDIQREEETPQLAVHSKYYLDGDLVNESIYSMTYDTDGERVYHTESGQELREFIKQNAFLDPQVTIYDEYESMVDV